MFQPTSHVSGNGKPLHVGDTVQFICEIGTNAERWYGYIESFDDRFVYVMPDCWYDIHGARQELSNTVTRVHPANLRSLAFH